jgi:hypothetical protein
MHLLDTDTLNRAHDGSPDIAASIALAHRATLVTRNLKHFGQIRSLQLENWID